MAGSSFYSDNDDQGITDINVTPFVDVVLVLLVVFMVTAKMIVPRGIEVEPPASSVGGEVPSAIRVTVKSDGTLWVNRESFTDDAKATARIQELAKASGLTKPRVVIAGDRNAAYGGVMRAITVVKNSGAPIALENERP